MKKSYGKQQTSTLNMGDNDYCQVSYAMLSYESKELLPLKNEQTTERSIILKIQIQHVASWAIRKFYKWISSN